MRAREPRWWYGCAPADRLLSLLLAPAGLVYGALSKQRLQSAPRHRSPLPVVCVGNFTAGGTGKTPFVLTLVEGLRRAGHVPVVLTRGHGGRLRGPHRVEPATDTAADVGDEPLLLAATVPVVVARDREAGARAIEALRTATVIVMDDGIQNPALAKTLTIAMIDGQRGFGNARCIPAGPLRAPLGAQLARSDALVINHGDGSGVAPRFVDSFSGPVLEATIAPAGDLDWLKTAPVVAFAGIGVPDRFFATVAASGGDIRDRLAFRDHHTFTAADATHLLALARDRSATLLTTEKDFARLRGGTGPLADLRAATRTLPIRLTLGTDSRMVLEQLIAERVPLR